MDRTGSNRISGRGGETLSKGYLHAQASRAAGYADAAPAPWPLAAAENHSAVSETIAEDLNRFLASIERRALRTAEIATGSRDEALDLVQDAMLQLARRYARRPATEWPPLFYRILDNRIRDWQRHQTVRRRLFGWIVDREPGMLDGEETMAAIPDPGQTEIVQQLKQQQAMATLEQALRKLPARQREAFVLRIWEGLNVEETAVAMGCSDGSVKTHLSRALHTLRAQLEGVWP